MSSLYSIAAARNLCVPLTRDPAVEEVQRTLRLVEGNHVASLVDTDEGQVATGLDLAVLLVANLQRTHLGLVVLLLSRPDKLLGPGLVTEPVADVVGVTGVDEHGNLLEDIRNEQVEGLRPVSVEEESTVNVGVAALVISNLGTDSLHDFGLVEVLGDPRGLGVAKVGLILALLTDIVHVVSRALEGTNQSVVTVNGTGHARPGATRIVAVLDQRLAAGQSVVHRLALALIENGTVVAAVVAASHGAVLSILSLGVGQTVTNGDALEVDVTLLVGQNLIGKHGNVVAGVRLARNVEVLGGILGEVVEKQSQKSVDILAGSNGVGDGSSAVRVTSIYGLINEDHGSILVPRKVVVLELELRVDAGRSQLHEETHHGGTSRATVQPEDNGVVLGVISGLEEPCVWIC